jgi:hypothetical protein
MVQPPERSDDLIKAGRIVEATSLRKDEARQDHELF